MIPNNRPVQELTQLDRAIELFSLFSGSEFMRILCPKEQTRVQTKYTQNTKVNQAKQKPEQWYNQVLAENLNT